MSRVRGLELLFNLEKKNFKSKEDCVVAVLHCLLINENLQCVGTGDEWSETDSVRTELLPENWNSNQNVYSLRYSSKDKKTRILLKATKMEHVLAVDAALNEDIVESTSLPVNKYVSDDYSDFTKAYKDLDSLCESFRKDIMENFNKPKEEKKRKNLNSPPRHVPPNPSPLSKPPNYFENPDTERDIFVPMRPPRVGGRDLDPFGGPHGGGMFMDPSSFGIPSRPTLPQFGVGGPGGLPRGAVPPGARFDPFMPPIQNPNGRRRPNPDFDPPDFDYFM